MNWMIEGIADPEKMQRQQLQFSDMWRIKTRTIPSQHFHLSLPLQMQACSVSGDPINHTYLSHIESFQADRSKVYAQEDKDRSVLWENDPNQYALRCLYMLLSSPSTWVPVQIDISAYVAMIYRLHCCLLSHMCVPHLPSPSRFFQSALPYMYFNPKAKCHLGIAPGLHTCVKKSHACFRKIVSYFRHPCRPLYRKAALGLRVLSSRILNTWAVPGLNVAVPRIHEANKKLISRDRCLNCQAVLENVHSLIVLDAAQMYEVVPRQDVISSVCKLTANLKPTISVFVDRSLKLGGYLCSKPSVNIAQATSWFDGPTLLAFVLITLAQNIVLCGGITWCQVNGVPIGGIFSSAIAGIVLGTSEDEWESLWDAVYARIVPPDSVQASKLPFPHLAAKYPRSLLFDPQRYEDDLFLNSKSLCPPCLELIPPSVYSVDFDLSKNGRKVIWADLLISSVSDGTINIAPKQSTLSTYWRDFYLDKLTLMVPPWLGQFSRSRNIIISTLSGRLARLTQMLLTPDALSEALATDLIKWLVAGYPLKVMYSLWCKVAAPKAAQVKAMIRRCMP